MSGRILQVVGPRASLCGVPRGHVSRALSALAGDAALSSAATRALGFRLTGTRGDRFQARYFYSGVRETENS